MTLSIAKSKKICLFIKSKKMKWRLENSMNSDKNWTFHSETQTWDVLF